MVELTEKELQDWKDTFAKDGIAYDTNDEYREAVHNLVGFFDVLVQMDLAAKQKARLDSESNAI
jgi:hypothetical protein